MTDTARRLVVPASKPRNPCVAAARFRQAGAHGRRAGEERRAGQRQLRRDLSELKSASRGRPPSP